MGISGKWGSGKNTLMKEVKKKLKNDLKDNGFRKIKTVWFDAWKYKEEDQILAALMEVIISTIEKDTNFKGKKAQKIKEALKKNWNRIDWFKFVNEIGKATVGIDVNEFLNLKDAETSEKEKYKEFLSFYDIFNKHFDDLLWSYLEVEKNKDENAALVIFIDDLDRCPLPKVVQILETIKIFLDKKGCIFVIGAAKDIIQDALKVKDEYKGVKAERFLEKIIQIDFSLPKKQVENATEFIKKIKKKLAIGDELNTRNARNDYANVRL